MSKAKRVIAVCMAIMMIASSPVFAKKSGKTDLTLHDYNDFSQVSDNKWIAAENLLEEYSPGVSLKRVDTGEDVLSMGESLIDTDNNKMPYIVRMMDDAIEFCDGRKIVIDVKFQTATDTTNLGTDGRGVRFQMKFNMEKDCSELKNVKYFDAEKNSEVSYSSGSNHLALWQVSDGKIQNFNGKYGGDTSVWTQTRVGSNLISCNVGDWCVVRTVLDVKNNSADFYTENLTTGEKKSVKNQALHFTNGDSLKSIAFANFYPMTDKEFDAESALGENNIDYVRVSECDSVDENGKAAENVKVIMNDEFLQKSEDFSVATGFSDKTSVSYGSDNDGTTYMRMSTSTAGNGNSKTPYIYMPIKGGDGISTKDGRKIAVEVKMRTDLQSQNWSSNARLQLKYNLPKNSAELGNVANPDPSAPINHKYYNASFNDCNLWEAANGQFRVADGYTLSTRQTSMISTGIPQNKDTWYIVKTLIDPIKNTADYEITDCATGTKYESIGKKLYFPIGDSLKSIAFTNFISAVPNADFDYIKVYEYTEEDAKNLIKDPGFENMSGSERIMTGNGEFYVTSGEAKNGRFSAYVSGNSYYIPLEVEKGEKYIVSTAWKSENGDNFAITLDGTAVLQSTKTDEWNTASFIYCAEKTGEIKLSSQCNAPYYIDDVYFAPINADGLEISGADKVYRGENAKYSLVLSDGEHRVALDNIAYDSYLTNSKGAKFADGILSIPEDEPLGKITLNIDIKSLGISAAKQIEIYDAVESEIIYKDAAGNILPGVNKDYAECSVKLFNKTDSERRVTVTGAIYEDDRLDEIFGTTAVTLSAKGSAEVDLGEIRNLGEKSVKVFVWQEMNPLNVTKNELKNTAVKEIYVAPWGDDSNDASFDAPLLTLEAARDKIRNSEIADGGVTVYIRGGEYKRNAVFSLTSADSGSKKKPIIYKAYDGEKPVFTQGCELKVSAADKVTDQEILSKLATNDAREHLYVFNLADVGIKSLAAQDYVGRYTDYVNSWIDKMKKAGKTNMDEVPLTPTNEVFYDNAPMTVARYPNGDKWLSIKKKTDVINGGAVPRYWEENMKGYAEYVPEENRDINDCFTFRYEDENPEYMKRWQGAADAKMFGFWYHSWATQSVGIKSIDAENGTITSDIPSYFGLRTDVNDYAKYYVFNLIEELDTPGEYYLDRANLKLYFYKSDGMTADKSLYISDGSYSFVNINNARFVTLDGLDFNMGRSTGIFIVSNNVTVRNCNVRNLSENAMTVIGENNLVENCRILNTDGGVTIYSMWGSGPQTGFKHSNSVVKDCVIENFSRRNLVYTNGITLSGVGNSAINNTLSDSYHMAVGINGQDNLFAGNEIYNVCHHATDASAVYFGRSWVQRGNMIVGNYIHDLHPDPSWAKTFGVNAVYADDNFAGANIIGNIFENIDGWAIKFNGCQDNRLENNVFINCRNRDTLLGGALNAGKTGADLSRLDTLKRDCIDQVNGLFSAEYFNDCWKDSVWAKETTETISGVTSTVSAKMNFVAAISGAEWRENEAENIATYINAEWHEKYPEIYEHLKTYAGESQNNKFINNILINCDADKIDQRLNQENRLIQDNKVLDASVLKNGFATVDYSKITDEELKKIRVSAENAGATGIEKPKPEYGMIVEDNCTDISGWSNYNDDMGSITSGVDSDGTTYVRLSTKKDSGGGNTNAAMLYNITDKNIRFAEDEKITIDARYRLYCTDEDSATNTGPYMAMRYNMPRNPLSGFEVLSCDESGADAKKAYQNGHYDLALTAISSGEFAYMKGRVVSGKTYLQVAGMGWTGNNDYISVGKRTKWLRCVVEIDKIQKKLYYKFYNEQNTLILETQGTLVNHTLDDYLNNIAFSTMNGNRGTAEIDVDYLKITRTKK